MAEALKQGLKSYAYISDMSDYTRKELVLKVVLLPLLYVLNTVLFLAAAALYIVERIFAFFFRLFIRMQSFLFRKKMHVQQSLKKLFTLGSVIVFAVFLPFILAYYLSLLFKTLIKGIMKSVIESFDFSDRFLKEGSIALFDDIHATSSMPFGGVFQDAENAQAIGSAFESILSEMHTETLKDEDDAEVVDAETVEEDEQQK